MTNTSFPPKTFQTVDNSWSLVSLNFEVEEWGGAGQCRTQVVRLPRRPGESLAVSIARRHDNDHQTAWQSRSAEYQQAINDASQVINPQRRGLESMALDTWKCGLGRSFYLRANADRQQHSEEHDRPELRHWELRERLRVHDEHQPGTCNHRQSEWASALGGFCRWKAGRK